MAPSEQEGNCSARRRRLMRTACSSPGKALFREALTAGTMEGYFSIAEQFHTQSDPDFCGLGRLLAAVGLAIERLRAQAEALQTLG